MLYTLPKFDEIKTNILVIIVNYYIKKSNMYLFVSEHFSNLSYFRISYLTLKPRVVEKSEGNATTRREKVNCFKVRDPREWLSYIDSLD